MVHESHLNYLLVVEFQICYFHRLCGLTKVPGQGFPVENVCLPR